MNDETMTPVVEIEVPAAAKSLSDLATVLEEARAQHARSLSDLEFVKNEVKTAALAERDAYKAFNDAVAAMKPKRPRKEKPEAGGEKIVKLPKKDKKAAASK